MGQITPELLSLMGVKWGLLPDDDSSGLAALQHACDYIRREQKPYVLVMPGDTFISNSQSVKPSQENHFSRTDALATFLDNVDEKAVVVATTGKTGRELFSLDDRQGHLYCVGSMGYASSIAHGIALVSTRQVYLLDGDGAAIMHLGNLTSIGSSRPANFTHIVLDNGCYDSTGGQPTASASVDFAAVALAVGYSHARECRSAADLCLALRNSVSLIGPKLLHVRINAGPISQVGRPTKTPYTVARRLRHLLIDGERPLATGLSTVDVDAGADVDSHPEKVAKYHT
jgi:phosphonopyruvate decarboxylase